jgi:hypothetical protein
MIKNVVQEIGGIGLYGVISLCLFFSVFTGALIWAFRHQREFCSSMSTLPLEEDAPTKGHLGHE